MLVLMLLLTFGIAVWNSYVAGLSWSEAKAEGGWRWGLQLVTGFMASAGFTLCYLICGSLFATSVNWITPEQAKLVLELGYILLVPGILLGGYIFTAVSWAQAYREGGIGNYGVAGWNTFASIDNTISVLHDFGGVFHDVWNKLFSGSDSDDDVQTTLGKWVIFAVVALCCVAGCATTAGIVGHVARKQRALDR